MAGTLDEPAGLEAAEHIYVDNKADYYNLNDNLPQHPQDGSGVLSTPIEISERDRIFD